MAARPSSRNTKRGAPAVNMVRREWTIASDVQAITPVVERLQALCQSAGFSARQCGLNIPVAVTEALSNAILRGNASSQDGQVHVAVLMSAERLVVEVTDEGIGFDLDAQQHSPRDDDWLSREDGRGVFLMRSLMDDVVSQRVHAGRGHTLRLILNRT